MKKVLLEDLRQSCIAAFMKEGVDQQSATGLTTMLIDNELDGYSSHGVMRVPDYIQNIKQGVVDNNAKPLVRSVNQFSTEITGNKSLNIKVMNAAETVVQGIKETPLHFITIKNAHHLGRLATLAKIMTGHGFVCFGFSNFNGLSQKVAPIGSAQGLIATNPIVYGIPSNDGDVILDMTTSVTSEGAVRQRHIQGHEVPEGWLMDKDGKSTIDASLFCRAPIEAMLMPLGGEVAGHKGFGLALIAEILSSIRPGTGNIAKPHDTGGNSAFFFIFKPEILGISLQELTQGMESILDHVKAGYKDLRIPGRKQKRDENFIYLPETVWEKLS